MLIHFEAPPAAAQRLLPADRAPDSLRLRAVEGVLASELGRLRAEFAPSDIEVRRALRLQPVIAAAVSRSALDRLARRPSVRFVEEDVRWRVHTEEGLPLIGARAAQALGHAGQGTAVAIIDTDVDPLHPTLGGGPIPNGRVVYGLDTADDDPDPSDCGTHGTAVTAVAAGSSYQWSPQLRFAGGVAPEAKILAYKASPDSDCGSIELSAVLAAIEDALLHRHGNGYSLAAINLSSGSGLFAGPCDDLHPSLRNAVQDAADAGVVVVASAGNKGSTTGISAPACLSQAIAVGSLWDVDAGWVGYSFCLDPACSQLCDDSFKPAKTVTCYTNVAPTLDLLAPSEYLLAGEAGGQVVQFGGTSGAAAYATGAVALLRGALPGSGAAETRLRLALTGQRVVDQRSSLVRPLLDIARAIERDDVAVAAPSLQLAAGSGPSTATSSLLVNATGPVGSMRVALHLVHDSPDALEVSLTSPDGTRVRLHRRGQGSVTAAAAEHGSAGIWGVYPDELHPYDSLAAFDGHEMGGLWTLDVLAATGSGKLVDWGLDIRPRQAPGADAPPTLVVPVVANGGGAGGSRWESDLSLLNTSTSDSATARVHLVPSDADGTIDFRQGELFLPPDSSRLVADVVPSLFGLSARRGALVISSDGPDLIASSWTAAVRGDGGRFRQTIGALPAARSGLAAGDPPVLLIGLSETPQLRTNIGFSELEGSPVTVEVAVRDGTTGERVAADFQYTVAPFSNLQTRLPAGAGRDNLYAVVTPVAGGGRVVAYASVADNSTHDATFVAGRRPLPAAHTVIPVVARNSGINGVGWRSRLVLAHAGGDPVELLLEYRPSRSAPGSLHTAAVTLIPSRVLALDDPLAALFGVTEGLGSLRILQADNPQPLVVTAAIAARTADGYRGQVVEPATEGHRGRAVVVHAECGHASRSNLGVCEVAGASIGVRCRMRDALGRSVGEARSLDIAPYQLVQVNDVCSFLGAEGPRDVRIELEHGDGAYVGYASVVDARTDDALYVPALPITE